MNIDSINSNSISSINDSYTYLEEESNIDFVNYIDNIDFIEYSNTDELYNIDNIDNTDNIDNIDNIEKSYKNNITNKSQSSINSNISECAICLEKLKYNLEYPYSCIHRFHKDCITTWINNDNGCPICRNEHKRNININTMNSLTEQEEYTHHTHTITISRLSIYDKIKYFCYYNKKKIKLYTNIFLGLLSIYMISELINNVYINIHYKGLIYPNNILQIFSNCSCDLSIYSKNIICYNNINNMNNINSITNLTFSQIQNINYVRFCKNKLNKLLKCNSVFSNYIIPFFKNDTTKVNIFKYCDTSVISIFNLLPILSIILLNCM